MTTDPAPQPAPAPPDAAVSVDEPVGAKERARVRWTAIFGFLGCLLLVVAWFLPWIHVPEEKRADIRVAVEPGLKELRRGDDPTLAQKYDVLVEAALDKGRLTGLDLFHLMRSGWALNRRYSGPDPVGESSARPWMVQRAYLVGAIVLAVLPAVAALLALHFLSHGFRRARSPVLILMTLVGCGAGALALAWMRFSEVQGLEFPTGIGLRLTAAAAIVQAFAGIFGVTSRNWWRVYAGTAVTLAAVVLVVWAYVTGGSTP